MVNSKFITGCIVGLTIFGLVGCSSILKKNDGVFGKSSKTVVALQADVTAVEKNTAAANEQRLTEIGAISKGGVQHALDQIPSTNVTPEVTVAKRMNDRVEALANKPDFKEVEAVKSIVDELLSQVDKTRAAGESALAKKDKEIEKLNKSIVDLNTQREQEIAEVFQQAKVDAAKEDQYKTTLGQMDSWFGLGAVFYGLKRFVVSAAWILGIGSVLFLILRILASSNPIAGAIFGIFDQVGSWLIHTIAMIFPKALSLAGNVSTKLFTSYKGVMTKFVDAVQMAKTTATAAGKEPNLKDVLDELEKNMDASEKAIVDDIKKSLNWK